MNKTEGQGIQLLTTALRKKLKIKGKVTYGCTRLQTHKTKRERVSGRFYLPMVKEFHAAYKNGLLSQDTRKAFLNGQLQDRLYPDLMQNISVLDALTDQELCMVARNEEK